MGSLYDCLREARLERYYPVLRANGYTRSQSLLRLVPKDCSGLGIIAASDKRRLFDLVNIIKSIYGADTNRNVSVSNRISEIEAVNSNKRKINLSSTTYRQCVAGLTKTRNANVFSGNQTCDPESVQVAHEDIQLDANRNNSETSTENRLCSEQQVQCNMNAPSPNDSGDDQSETDSSNESSNLSEDTSDNDEIIENTNVPTYPARQCHPPHSQTINQKPIEMVVHNSGYNYGLPRITGGRSANCRKRHSRSPRYGNVLVAGSDAGERIKVCVRKRPLSKREVRANEEDLLRIHDNKTVIVNEAKQAVDLSAYTLQHEFVFDEVFNEFASNEDVYDRAAKPLIDCVFNSGSATCFAYGQTGAGKTHTMLGGDTVPGLYLLAAQDIFRCIHSAEYGVGLKVWVSFFEIYCGQLFDLLNKRKRLFAREDGSGRVCIAGISETQVMDSDAIMQVLEYGNQVRSKGASGVNPDSSRSHAILQLEVRDNMDHKKGRISFIDLAGSERAADTSNPSKQTRMEGAEINQSLLALKECIRSLDQESRHTPFRQSKLTHILKDSFIGNSRTCMIANVSPNQTACEHTLNTLRYADRVKSLKRDSQADRSNSSNTLSTVPSGAFVSNSLTSSVLSTTSSTASSMNIPPAVFHPSNVTCSSTPVKPRVIRHTDRNRDDPQDNDAGHQAAAAAAVTMPWRELLDFPETPISGHTVGRSSVATKNMKSSKNISQKQPVPSAASLGDMRIKSPTLKQSISQNIPAVNVSRPGANQAERHSSEGSDKTDSDSCNVPAQRQPVHDISYPEVRRNVSDSQNLLAESDDTEIDVELHDLESTDYNELNDLNKTVSSKKEITIQSDAESLVNVVGFRISEVDVGSDASVSTVLLHTDSGQSGTAVHSRPIQIPQVNTSTIFQGSPTHEHGRKRCRPKLILREKINSPVPTANMVDRNDNQDDPDDMLFGSPLSETKQTFTYDGYSENMDWREQQGVDISNRQVYLNALFHGPDGGQRISDKQNMRPDQGQHREQRDDNYLRTVGEYYKFDQNNSCQVGIHSVPLRNNDITHDQSGSSTGEEKIRSHVSRRNTFHQARPRSPSPSPKSNRSRSYDELPATSRAVAASVQHTDCDDQEDTTKESVVSVSSSEGPRRTKSDPLLARQLAKRQLPSPSEFLKQYTKASLTKYNTSNVVISGALRKKSNSLPEQARDQRHAEISRKQPGSNETVNPPVFSHHSDTLAMDKTTPIAISSNIDNPLSSPIVFENPPTVASVGTVSSPVRNEAANSPHFTAFYLGKEVLPSKNVARAIFHQHTSSDGNVKDFVIPQQSFIRKTESSESVNSMTSKEVEATINSGPSSNEEVQAITEASIRQSQVHVSENKPESVITSQPPRCRSVPPNLHMAGTTGGQRSHSPVTVTATTTHTSSHSNSSTIQTEKLARYQFGSPFTPLLAKAISDTSSKRIGKSQHTKIISKDVIQSQTQSSTVTSSMMTISSSVISGLTDTSTLGATALELDEAKLSLVSQHEEQLVGITNLCKHEMKLLLSVKAGHKEFGDYVQRVGDILNSKMKRINLLQDQLKMYVDQAGRNDDPPATR